MDIRKGKTVEVFDYNAERVCKKMMIVMTMTKVEIPDYVIW